MKPFMRFIQHTLARARGADQRRKAMSERSTAERAVWSGAEPASVVSEGARAANIVSNVNHNGNGDEAASGCNGAARQALVQILDATEGPDRKRIRLQRVDNEHCNLFVSCGDRRTRSGKI